MADQLNTTPKRRRGRRYDLHMRSPIDGLMHQISGERHSQQQREEFLSTYLAAGWKNPELRPVTCADRLLVAEIARLRSRVAELEARCASR